MLLSVKRDLNRRLKENRGIHEIFREVVLANGGKNAMTEVATGKEVTFAEFDAHCNQYANYFKVFDPDKDFDLSWTCMQCPEFQWWLQHKILFSHMASQQVTWWRCLWRTASNSLLLGWGWPRLAS